MYSQCTSWRPLCSRRRTAHYSTINILRKSEPGVTEVLTRPYKDPLATSSRSSLATSTTTSLDGVQEIRVPVAWLDSVALVRT
jgi:hypothetical protein